MTIKQKIFKLFNTRVSYYKGISVNIFGLPIFQKENKGSVKNEFYSLCNDGYLKVEDKNLILTKKGRSYLKDLILDEKIFENSFPKDSPKDMLLMYDIPEDKKSEREWLRRHLVKFNYIMIQRSVWVGPSPLPKDFVSYIKKIGLRDNLKTFKLAKGYMVK